MPRLPKGMVTFLVATFSAPSSGERAEVLRTALAEQGGVLFEDTGPTIQIAFRAALPALESALAAQRALQAGAAADQPAGVGMVLHSGLAHDHDGVYVGQTLNHVRCLALAGHPGQILLSASVQDSLQERLPPAIEVRLLGEYRLKDLGRTERLFQVLAPDLRSTFAPLITLDSFAHNLPVQDSPLIGREQEVSTACALLQDPAMRLVTLLGSSGMGKTRLALQVAVEVLADFADGVWFVALAPVSNPDLLISMIAQELGVKEGGKQPLLENLIAFLRSRHMLLVLDNFEQLLAAAPTITQLLAATQHVRLLVTSQLALNVEHEHVFTIPPLAMPDPTKLISLGALSQIPVVALFIERARDVQPTFTLTDLMAPAVIELCTRLEGLPLAIELVAAQSKRYFPGDMLIMLQNRLSVARSIRRGDTREDTLRPVLDWICEVLGSGAAGLFARLGVFAGGCTSESASAICNPANDLALDVEQTLTLLVDNHLVLREELKEGHARYAMLDAIHDYAEQRLKKRREVTRIQTTHASYYTTLAETAEPLLKTAEQQIWLERLEAEHHNFRAALTWGLAQQPELALRLSGALWRFWYIRGHFSEGRRWLQLSLDQAPVEALAARGKALHGLGVLAFYQADYAQAQRAYETALDIRRELKDTSGIVATLNNLGILVWQQGDFARAASLYEACLPLWRELGDQWGLATTLSNVGLVALEQADFARAAPYFQESLIVREQLQDTWGCAVSLCNLGLVAYYQGDYAQAEALLSRSLSQAEEINDDRSRALAFEAQALVALAQGQVLPARRLLVDATHIRQKQGDSAGLLQSLESFADLLVAEGQPGAAVTCMSAAAGQRTLLGSPASPLNLLSSAATQTQVQGQLTQAAYAAAWQLGAAMPLTDLLEQLLDD